MEMHLTPTTERNLANIRTALETSNAVLIQGEIGCGKSLAVHYLAEQYNAKETMIQVNVDDTFDSKDLLGKFTATETPGAFEWAPGPLTLAVEKGYWILMEDIDLASFDVFSVILSLLENSTLFISDKNRTLTAHKGFKLIATQQLYVSGDSLFARKGNAIPYAELWGAIIMESLPAAEVFEIVRSTNPAIPFSVVESLAQLNSAATGPPLLSLRSLLKWSRRVSKRLLFSTGANKANNSHNKAGAGSGFISSTMREIMLKEAFDCFVARFAPGAERSRVLELVATACGVPENVAQPLVNDNKPMQTLSTEAYAIGRITIPLISTVSGVERDSRIAFAPTQHAMSLLERLAAAVESKEHVLLTGETGVGKTFIVQYLADQLGQKLIVHNLNQQTDTSDFMGGWKPLDVGSAVREVYTTFTDLFSQCFNAEKNVVFLNTLQQVVNSRKWERAVRHVLKGCSTFRTKHNSAPFDIRMVESWSGLEAKSEELLDTIEKTKANFAFFFEEGSLVKAWREGHWILLDELNLASTEVLERVSSVLGDVDRLFLTDKGDSDPIPRHPNFHVFANMNPPTDVGKKDLPPSLRSRFTECYVSEPFSHSDIAIVVNEYIGFLTADPKVDEISNFFLDCVQNAKTKLCALDGESKPPSFSLRTLTRALSYVRKATPLYGFSLALFDGLLLGFATPLQRQFHDVVEQLIVKNVFKGKRPNPPTLPAPPATGKYTPYEHMWIPSGDQPELCDESFILTRSVKGHLTNLARAVFASRPVLLEGPTSSGKSSMVKYLAELTGNRFVRINNHDSTEVQEYLGHYVTDEYGKLRFVDGILVNAVRHGYWVVLDELNLAPTDVLEALNRLLDDNCELFIPDTQETIKPHPQLRIFATQNPAGVYGGRKLLSRAFRNRFLEITVDEIPNEEISTILQQRYALPESFAERMVEVMTALQIRRQSSQIFAGRHGFITPRDLFRWAERKPATYQELAEHGFLLLGERCRKAGERQIVKDVIESVTKTEIDEKRLYHPSHWPFVGEYYALVESGLIADFKIVWTESMQRLFTIVGICLEHKEPVLLVGETGSSKTTVCQLWAALMQVPLRILNCHQHTEAADFLGSLRPSPPDRRDQALFEWRNGPLVQCMLDGDFFVLDEISLTEDSVLERLNSVLEPGRSVTLAEKSSADCIVAHDRFRVMATMNPGGDFGKKELSPALRNRFTEVYVRPTTEKTEVAQILTQRLQQDLAAWADKMATVLCSVSTATSLAGTPQHISIRDIIGWVEFMNAAHGHCPSEVAFMQGLDAVILDGIGVGTGQSEMSAEALRETCEKTAAELMPAGEEADYQAYRHRPFWEFFEGMCEPTLPPELQKSFFFGAPATQRNLSKLMRASIVKKAVLLEGSPGVGKTSIVEALGSALGHPIVRINLSEQTDIMDLLGTYLPRPSSGDDANDAAGPQFDWSDGVLLRALKEGAWVILDELNLASQSVLEGLNALLDHRSTVFIPELNEAFQAHEHFRVFACQNPLIEGGGRKGLPRSFLNRFIKVRIEAFETADLICILQAVCPDIDTSTLLHMVDFVGQLQQDTMVRRLYGTRGGPWEFNLRDALRWAKLLQRYDVRDRPTSVTDMLFIQRMRTDVDRAKCTEALLHHFGHLDCSSACNSNFLIRDDAVYFDGRRLATRGGHIPSHTDPLLLLPSQAETVKSLLMCAEQNQFVLLVGPAGAGKTFTLRTAAALAGAKLMTFSMNASCDTVDLLGGFDQVEGKQGQFEWRDSIVLEAMLQGHWLVLDNVNYCNASVLDRLNPLVEPNGVLSINEQGLVNNEVRVIRPHPNFRLFATLNPRYGEISRAMRNRAVELYVSPVAIPSVEGVTLAATSGGDTATEAAVVLDALNEFHHTFVQLGFQADSEAAASGQLSDALAAGAPNVFTLLRTSAMLPSAGASAVEALARAIQHRYLDNRSGHWRYKKAELEATLHTRVEEVKAALQDPAFSRGDVVPRKAYPLLKDSVAAFSVGPRDAMALQRSLAQQRALRTGLAVKRVVAAAAATSSPEKATEVAAQETVAMPPPVLSDVLLHFLVEQCFDATALDAVADARRELLALSGITSDEVLALVDPANSVADVFPSMFCQAMRVVGPHADVLSCLRATHGHVTESVLVNSSAAELLTAVGECLRRTTSPQLFQRLSAVAVPLVRDLLSRAEDGIHVDNYVSLLTRAVLLHRCVGEEAQLGSSEVPAALGGFLDALRQYLSLPFPLLGGKSVLHGHVRPAHITTAEERATFQQWQLVAKDDVAARLLRRHRRARGAENVPGDDDADDHALPRELLASLWEHAAFRAEFHLLQCLLQLHTGATAPTSATMTAVVAALQEDIRAFLDRFARRMPLFSDLETTLWRAVLALPATAVDETRALLEEFTPLLVSRFVSRYGLHHVISLLPGAWASSANACLRYASEVPVIAIGSANSSEQQVLTGLATFLSNCAVVPPRPFVEWERSAWLELGRLLRCCFPDVSVPTSSVVPASSQLLHMYRDALDSAPSSTTVTSATAPSSVALAVHPHKPLIAQILRRLASDTGDTLLTMSFLWGLKCRLLLPTSPVDPMFRRGCERQMATEEVRLLSRMEAAFAWAEQLTLRADTPQAALIRALREQEQDRLWRAEQKYVQRPDDSGRRYATLVRVLYRITSTLLSDDRLASLAADNSEATLRSRESWSELLYQEVIEVLREYGGYEDVTLNFAESALLAALAARASCCQAGKGGSSADRRVGDRRTLFGLHTTLQLMHFPSPLVSGLPLPGATSAAPLRNRLQYLDSCLTVLQGANAQGMTREFVEEVFDAFRGLYRNVEAVEEQERRDAELAVQYKERAITIEGDDEKLLRKLKDLFPSYEQEFIDAADEGAVDVEETDDTTAASVVQRTGKHARIMFAEHDGVYVRRLVETHEGFYARLIAAKLLSGPTSESVVRAFQARFDVLSGELPRYGEESTGWGVATSQDVTQDASAEQRLLTGFSSRVALSAAALRATTATLEEKRDSGFNVFTDPEPSEVGRFSKALEKLLAAIDVLIVSFPENVVLQRCRRVGRKIATLPALSTPLMKIMTGSEILLRECYEWERNASLAVSIMTHMTELSGFVLRWRRLELHCWSHVFDAKYAEFELKATLQWFYFYDLVREAPTPEDEAEGKGGSDSTEYAAAVVDHCRRVFEAFSRFMWDACYGDFAARLRVVCSFGFEAAATHGAASPLASVILHVADFFRQFEPFVQEQRTKAIRTVEEDIADFTKIMRWEDANYYAVRATAEKSHLKMARVLSSLEEALRTPVLPAISAEEERCEEDAAMGVVLPSEKHASPSSRSKKAGKRSGGGKQVANGAAGGAASASTGGSSGKSSKRSRTGKKMSPDSGTTQKKTKGQKAEEAEEASVDADAVHPLGPWQPPAVSAAYEFYEDSTREVVTRVAALQQPKTPMQMKVRALKTLFDVMADAGVPHTHEGQAEPWELLFASTEALLSCRTVHNDQSTSGAIDPAATELYRFARWLQRMREAERKPNPDLSGAQVKRGTGLAETLFAQAVTVSEVVCGLFQLHDTLKLLQLCAGAAEEDAAEAHDGDGPASLTTALAGREVVESGVELCSAAQSLHASLSWMLQERVLGQTSTDAGSSSAAVDLSVVQELKVEADHLWQLCVQHEPLRRRSLLVPAAVAEAYATALRRVHGCYGRLQNSADARLAAAAVPFARQTEKVLVAYDAAVSASAAPLDEREMKRRRTEKLPSTEAASGVAAVAASSSSSWFAKVQTVMDDLRASLEVDGSTVGTAAASPDIVMSPASPAPTAEGGEEKDDDGEAANVYAPYVEKIASLKESVAHGVSALEALLADDSTALDALSPSERRLVQLRTARCAASLEHVQHAVIATLAVQAKFGVVLSRLFTILMKKGFCKTEEDENTEDNGDGDGGQQQNGTGMDDGEGEKDVTNEMENEDQLMNMKDKEEQPEDGQEKKDGEEEEDEQDNAADVETDFQAPKEQREESEKEDDGGDEEGEDSENEMGSVDEGEEQERKKTKKDKGDANDMSEDEGDGAEEVPEDEFGDELDGEEDETGGFDNKEDEIREAERERAGEHELVGNEEDIDQEGMEDEEADSDDASGDERSVDRSDEEADEDKEEDGVDSQQEAQSEEREEGASGSEDRQEDEESTDLDRSTNYDDEREVEGDDVDSDAGTDLDAKSDAPDENVYDGGQQDNQVGEEATERDKDAKKPESSKQQDAAGRQEEQQPSDEQQEDDAGRNWKRQQEQNAEAQRKDNSERTRAQHNPYRAIKEALQRHQRQMQQLNLDKHVNVKDDDMDDHRDDKKQKDQPPGTEDDKEAPNVEEFDFDEEGEQTGLAATEERERAPTEAEDNTLPEANSDDEEGEEEAGSDEDGKDDAPQDTRRRRKKQAEEVDMEDEKEENDDSKESKKKKRNRKAVKLTARDDNASDEEDPEDTDNEEDKTAEAAVELDEKLARGRKLWLEQEAVVQGLSQQLCEQLRLILAPTLADKLQGDYKTGKRLNMKRIIPYIASQFKKDRIWLRRTKPNKRTYQILVALDDSLSMQCNNSGLFSCQAVALIAKALQQLEVGEVGIACFGKETKIVHGLEEPFLADSGPRAFSEITFQQTSTNLKLMLETTLQYLDAARERMHGQTRSTTQQLQQVMFIISDGQITEDRAELRKLLVRAEEQHQMVVFVLLDIKADESAGAVAAGDGAGQKAAPPVKAGPVPALTPKDLKGLSTAERMRRLKADRDSRLKRVQSNSILDMQLVEFKGGKVVRRGYMEDFPFPYYLIVRELQRLPEIIADAMRQWFELLNAGQ